MDYRGVCFFDGKGFSKDEKLPGTLPSDVVVYEVFRVKNGVSLFLEDHMGRFFNSCKLVDREPEISLEKTRLVVKSLSEKNGFDEGNIMLKYIFRGTGALFLLYFIPHSYPSYSEYVNGVSTGLLYQERQNPHAKVENKLLREMANQLMKENGWFEVLLVDSEGSITEGSRSNVFFVKGSDLYCAPLNKVLKGITLLKVLDICEEKGLKVHFGNIRPPKLADFDAAFLTGTSPKVLPLCSVGQNKFSTANLVVEKIRKRYDQMIEEYMELH